MATTAKLNMEDFLLSVDLVSYSGRSVGIARKHVKDRPEFIAILEARGFLDRIIEDEDLRPAHQYPDGIVVTALGVRKRKPRSSQ
jgi:hypothetical protein